MWDCNFKIPFIKQNIWDTKKMLWWKIICLNEVYKFSWGSFLPRCIFYVLILKTLLKTFLVTVRQVSHNYDNYMSRYDVWSSNIIALNYMIILNIEHKIWNEMQFGMWKVWKFISLRALPEYFRKVSLLALFRERWLDKISLMKVWKLIYEFSRHVGDTTRVMIRKMRAIYGYDKNNSCIIYYQEYFNIIPKYGHFCSNTINLCH